MATNNSNRQAAVAVIFKQNKLENASKLQHNDEYDSAKVHLSRNNNKSAPLNNTDKLGEPDS